jgi:IMP cyclohydrolase
LQLFQLRASKETFSASTSGFAAAPVRRVRVLSSGFQAQTTRSPATGFTVVPIQVGTASMLRYVSVNCIESIGCQVLMEF